MYLLLKSPSRWAWVARSTAAEWQRSTARRPGSNSPFLYPPSLVVWGEREAGGGSTRRPSSPLAFHSPSVFQSAFLWSGVGRRKREM